ncbi:hypothetical protein B0H14DRAFT_2615720 [Mycena olivaceomarginata]|nr:hypothetical protein B0H14DRAFT_2615720 [Mycena olivaceomarginata]
MTVRTGVRHVDTQFRARSWAYILERASETRRHSAGWGAFNGRLDPRKNWGGISQFSEVGTVKRFRTVAPNAAQTCRVLRGSRDGSAHNVRECMAVRSHADSQNENQVRRKLARRDFRGPELTMDNSQKMQSQVRVPVRKKRLRLMSSRRTSGLNSLFSSASTRNWLSPQAGRDRTAQADRSTRSQFIRFSPRRAVDARIRSGSTGLRASCSKNAIVVVEVRKKAVARMISANGTDVFRAGCHATPNRRVEFAFEVASHQKN